MRCGRWRWPTAGAATCWRLTGAKAEALVDLEKSSQLYPGCRSGPAGVARRQAGSRHRARQAGRSARQPELREPGTGRTTPASSTPRRWLRSAGCDQAAPTDWRMRRFVGMTLERVGHAARRRERVARGAARRYQESYEIRRGARRRASRRIATSCATSAWRSRSWATCTGRRRVAAAAVPSYREALAVFERLARVDPTDVNAARTVAISREKLGAAPCAKRRPRPRRMARCWKRPSPRIATSVAHGRRQRARRLRSRRGWPKPSGDLLVRRVRERLARVRAVARERPGAQRATRAAAASRGRRSPVRQAAQLRDPEAVGRARPPRGHARCCSGRRPATTRPGRRSSTCSTTSCGSWPRRRCGTSVPATRCSRRRWSTRPTSAWPTTAAGSRTGPTSSAWPPAPCAASSSITRGRAVPRSAAAARPSWPWTISTTCRSTPAGTVDLVALDDALVAARRSLDPRQGQMVELRFFGGLSVEETAAVVGPVARGPSSASGRWPAPGCAASWRVGETPVSGLQPPVSSLRFVNCELCFIWPPLPSFLAMSLDGRGVVGGRRLSIGATDPRAAGTMGTLVVLAAARRQAEPHHPGAR